MCAEHRRAQRGRPKRPAPGTLPDDLYDYDDDPAPRISRLRGSPPHVFDVEKLPVIDDWPDEVPITDAEIQVFERWFADVFDEMFGSLDLPEGLLMLSKYDNEKP
ncbi:hypothetical protein ROTAS13_00016 [Roseomonas sp. TAS13]|uniref:hypothetical protein n=1 Tax=Roseomonas sp. TAS13 TaxID=1926319 RepID=UPI000969F70C|nr:hypothetical protein [Roseomonas sp. TAS13]USQ70314.1 hypothetical protein NF552_12160 [Roseomonas mucosa]GAV32384.1 hypothetical protein ROTAS13_00016 [Roseomonas sp. TAS13]